MRNPFSKENVVLVPPIFDSPSLAARTMMLESSYNLLFGKLALRSLFEDYFEKARHFSTRIMYKPIDDPHVDLTATVSGPFDHKPNENIVGNALFRWQSDIYNPHTFMDFFVSNTDPVLLVRSSAYYPDKGFGAFGYFLKKRVSSEDYGVMGLRYGSSNLSIGATLMPFSLVNEFPKSAWLVGKIGRLTAGLQYEPHFGSRGGTRFNNLENWSCAIGYGLESASLLSPSFNFSLECVRRSQFNASFYQHVVLQRRVKNPYEGKEFEGKEVVGIMNYIDFGFELQTRVDDNRTSSRNADTTFQVAASWQADKNFLVKGKAGPLSLSIALAFKPWWKPSFTFNVSAIRDHTVGNTSFGFGIRVDNLREASYQRADRNFVMLAPNKEHLADGIQWKHGKRPVLQSDVDSGNFVGIPMELRSLGRIL
ncbi:hypothetical protein Vadar_033937 [Vaccinium darrowii]|uniref:Uncharacterized protein n=1 Tax=Vaccinium darrowii TaxID=229202 RepID=A0ACB7YHU0_9ERIC|nr:hypothetical protein Vadar_033937 [Vaccinium darrowii]